MQDYELHQQLTGKKRPRQEWFWLTIPKDRRFFTPEEVARMLMFDVRTIWKWCRQGKIPVYRVGRHYRISVEDFSGLLERRQMLIKQGIRDQL